MWYCGPNEHMWLSGYGWLLLIMQMPRKPRQSNLTMGCPASFNEPNICHWLAGFHPSTHWDTSILLQNGISHRKVRSTSSMLYGAAFCFCSREVDTCVSTHTIVFWEKSFLSDISTAHIHGGWGRVLPTHLATWMLSCA